ncbi:MULTISPECIES: RNA polymerase sporulation sigma factor SigK [unclassified Sporosarcina]|uniref:RNA polymerase sporulation sigma factor SigK n=1 Tax=unclassified Sporosarcina TaxID=2647733 RepID=UPI000C1731F1|nr:MULTISPECIES: RNA polymerase sporulation sigma factor SigK [unclassified Sporosarcina]PID00489.1 RNA polymerase subunit sigma-70 [Sporosarcina sp. P29]PID05778.1 RNA polymerase subunit sigma-70 [Sporosarcina sp. P30]PID08972.1 RNA polymerase subunit sigma-70 [Sporosarcina sp. P31]PID12058.1 RNA polymerase subunit sigma-70 [Sporosarcina sp. P32b]
MSGFFLAVMQLWLEIPALIGYIRGQAFLRPLSKKEEAECLRRLAEGDVSARDELIEHNMRLVAHIVKKFQPKHELLDDYISIGAIGLMKAVNSFTPDRKTKLATYAARCIENEILMYLRTQKKVQKDVSLYEPIGMDKDGQSLEIADLLQTNDIPPQTTVEQNEQKERLYRHLDKLDSRELEIIQRRYGLLDDQPMTQKEIAEQLNISRSYVSRIEKRAIVKLYQSFKHEYQ